MRTFLALAIAGCTVVCGQATATAHWRLDETMGTLASDSSPNANDGTLVAFGATPWTTGVHGGALTFNASQHVSCALNAGLPAYDASGSPFTITAWVNGSPQDDDRFYSEGSSTNNNPLYTLGSGRNSNTTADRFQLFVRTDSGGVLKNTQSVGTAFDSTWHHVAVVDVAGSVTVYIDGVADNANFNYTISGANSGVNRVALGAVLRAGTCCNYTGMLDDVRVYPFALSSVDVGLVINNGPLGGGFQTNQPGATLVVDGATGSPSSAASVSLALGQAFSMELSTTLAGNLWELGFDSVPTIPNAVVFSANIVNLNLASPSLAYVNANFSTPFAVAPTVPGLTSGAATASALVSMTAPTVMTIASLQFAMLDPGSADGFTVSGPADITVQ